MMPTFEKMQEELRANGIVFLRNFIPREEALEIRNEIEKSVRTDLDEREKSQQMFGRFVGSMGVTHNNLGKHIMTDFFGRSLKLDQSVGRFFEDENVSRLLKFIGGDYLKLRGYNTRRMNGPLDYSAMEWHRDNAGEFTIGIVLSEAEKSNDSSTCYIPGSHLYPYCPFVEAQFTMPHPIPMRPLRERFFSSLLEKKTTSQAQFAVGQPGDIYIFLGDLWHGRRANLIGNNDVVFFIGLFPSEVPFPTHSEVHIPSEEVLAKLPSALRRVVDFRLVPENSVKNSYFYQMQEQKIPAGFFSLWRWAQLEVQFWKKFKKHFLDFENQFLALKNFWIRVVGKVRRTLKMG